MINPKPTTQEFDSMYQSMVIDTSKQSEINQAVNQILSHKDRYQAMAAKVNSKIPWYAIGIPHYLECDSDFTQHIHNGDSLKHRTINVPSGRPAAEPQAGANKPYSWEESCEDWLHLKQWDKWQSWGISDILLRLEENNGEGYRAKGIPTPYVWSYTNFYGATSTFKGKYVADGKFDPTAISKEVGAAVLIKELISK